MRSNSTASRSHDMDTTRPTATYTPTGPRLHTLSVAIPSSLVHNSKRKLDLRTSLVGSVARALAVFSVDEIVIFNDGDATPVDDPASRTTPDPNSTKLTAFSHPGHFFAYLLSYLETPPFMRKWLFPMHENLSKAGVLPSLDMPTHLKGDEWCEFREGVTVQSDQSGTWVDCGLAEHRLVEGVQIPPNTRVTLKLGEVSTGNGSAEAVSPAAPREHAGYYWGYQVREAESLSAVFTECQYDGGYDLSIGTSERGRPMSETLDAMSRTETSKTWKHLIIVFGGVKGLEEAAKNDRELVRVGVEKSNVKDLFDYWVNLLPNQGSRTIRTEEALWMGLMATRALVEDR